MPLHWGPDRHSGPGIPKPEGVVVRSRNDVAAIGAEGDGIDRAGVSLEGPTNRLASGAVPHPHVTAGCSAEDGAAIGAEGDGGDVAEVPYEGLADGLAGGGIPQPQGFVV